MAIGGRRAVHSGLVLHRQAIKEQGPDLHFLEALHQADGLRPRLAHCGREARHRQHGVLHAQPYTHAVSLRHILHPVLYHARPFVSRHWHHEKV